MTEPTGEHHQIMATGTASDGLPVDLNECGLCHEEWPCRGFLQAETARLRAEVDREIRLKNEARERADGLKRDWELAMKECEQAEARLQQIRECLPETGGSPLVETIRALAAAQPEEKP